ncbi:MAG: 50S ribosomal protein L13 [Candidatus Omnitrophota bacterium]
MKTFLLKKEDVKRSNYIIDADGKVLGRLATKVAGILSGKVKPDFTPYVDSGDSVIVINAEKIKITGTNKPRQKKYFWYSGYPAGQRVETLEDLMKRKPQDVITAAVKGMLPKNKFQKDMISRLRVYAGNKHPHQAQKPVAV